MRLSSRLVFILALIFLISSAASIITSHHGFALRLIIFSFWLLVVGTAVYLFKLNDESKK